MSVVLVATNGSDACRRAVARTADLFDGATVVVVTVVRGRDQAGASALSARGSDVTEAASDVGVRQIVDDLALDAGRALLAETCKILGDRARPMLLTGDPVDALVEAARTSGAGALVVGSLGVGPMAGVLGSSVGAALVRDAPCSVIELG